jgi:succinoglycan biosynthesis protein ExoO
MISFLIANYNGTKFLRSAVDSALKQRGIAVEVIIADDCSTDDSRTIASTLAQNDSRVRFVALESNGGPAAARNAALDLAQGEWVAVLDNDDLLHPDRSARLIANAEACGADMIADDLILFDDDGVVAPHRFLDHRRIGPDQWIGLTDYLDQTRMHGRAPNLGFLKPVWRRSWLKAQNLRYDQRLRIAEDDDLCLRALLAGARYRLVPEPLYFYRKHGASISHRLSPDHADRMVTAIDKLSPHFNAQPSAVRKAWSKRSGSIRSACAFAHMVDAIKQQQPDRLVRHALVTPAALGLFRQPIGAMMTRLLPRRKSAAVAALGGNDVVFISRQRITGANNGSSAYLLALAGAVRDAGRVPHLVQPSPALFGRTPFHRLSSDLAVFGSIRTRSAARWGDWQIALSPEVWFRALHGVAARIAGKFGMARGWLEERKAPYAISTPWSVADKLFVARYARARCSQPVVLLDYLFQTEALPFLMAPDAQSAIVMHDRFSARAAQFDGDAKDSVALLDEAQEIALLAKAGAVIAIQQDEANFIRTRLPSTKAILAPMAASVVPNAAPGDSRTILFVGSNTAPNVHGLNWFLAEVWPLVRQACPDAVLQVAGKVSEAIDVNPVGVAKLGLVPDLVPLYAKAGVVISPLLQGSGLKIKLIEAIVQGKACVVSSVTLQGVADLLSDAVICADEPAHFADSVVSLLNDDAARAALAGRARKAAEAYFGKDVAFADFREWLLGRGNQGVDFGATDHARM